MAQLNVQIDDDLYKRTKMACIEYGTNLRRWVSAALETALVDAESAKGLSPVKNEGKIEIIEPDSKT